ncbi:MAG: hypothetical protein FWF68_05750 [Spirochaetes bacterium]|nr:hypothetical protein [Spirochaetota bacterium]
MKNPNNGQVKTSKGTISSISGGTYTLSGGFSITISGGFMTGMSGTISFTDGSTQAAPASLTSVKDGGDGTLNGTWKKGGETVTFNGSKFTYKGGDVTAPGTATYGGGILVTQGNYGGDNWVVAGNYSLSGSTITFSGFKGTFATQFSGSWVKQ